MSACVYIVQTNNGEVKIGLSGSPYSRLSQIKKEYGRRRGFTEAYLAAYVVTDYGLLVESLTHRLLDEFAVGGEWYEVSFLIALSAVFEAAQTVGEDIRCYAIGPEPTHVSVKEVRALLMKDVVLPSKTRKRLTPRER